MDIEQLGRGAGEQSDAAATRDESVAELAFIASRVKHAAELALIAAQGDEPERAARYLIDACTDHGEDLKRLGARFASAALAAIVVSYS